jgi:hypothetical protein
MNFLKILSSKSLNLASILDFNSALCVQFRSRFSDNLNIGYFFPFTLLLRDVTVAIHESRETLALCRKQRFSVF